MKQAVPSRLISLLTLATEAVISREPFPSMEVTMSMAVPDEMAWMRMDMKTTSPW
jgi:hypothetical protein